MWRRIGVLWIFILLAPAASIVANSVDFPWPVTAKSVQDDSSALRQLKSVKAKLNEANEQLVKDGEQFERDADTQRQLMSQVGALKTERARAALEQERAVAAVAAEKNRTIAALTVERGRLQDSVADSASKLQGLAAKSAEEEQQLEALRKQQQISAASEAARFKAAIASQVAMKLNMSQYAAAVNRLKEEKHDLERTVQNLTEQNVRAQQDFAGKLQAGARESQAQLANLIGENKRLKEESAMLKKGTEQFAMHEKSTHETQAQTMAQTIQKLKAENSDLLQAKSRLEAQDVFMQDRVRKMATGDAQAKAAGEAWKTSAAVELTNLRKEKEGMSALMEKMMKDSALGKARVAELEKMAYAAKASEMDLQDKLKKMAVDGARVTGVAARTTEALKASAEAQTKQLRAENQALSARVQELVAESDKQKEQLVDLQNQGLEAQAANASMGTELVQLRSAKESLYTEMQQLLNESDRQKEQIGELQKTALEAKEESQRYQQMLEDSKRELETSKATAAMVQNVTEQLAMHEKSVHESQAGGGLQQGSLTGISSERQALYKSWQDGANTYQEEDSRLMQQLIDAVETKQTGGGEVEVGLLKRLMERKQQLHKEQQEHFEKSQEQEATLSRHLQEVLAQTSADKDNYRKALMEKTTAMVYDTARWKTDVDRLSDENLNLKAELLKVTTENEHMKEKVHAGKKHDGSEKHGGTMTSKSAQKPNAEKTDNPVGAMLSSLFNTQPSKEVSEEEHKLGEVVKKWKSEHNHPKEPKKLGTVAKAEDWINDVHSMHSKEATKVSEVRSRAGDLFSELVEGLNKMRSEKSLLQTQLESDQMTIRALRMKCGESSSPSFSTQLGTSLSASPASEYPTSPALEVSKLSVDPMASPGRSQYQLPSSTIPGTNVPLEIGNVRQKSVQWDSVPTPTALLGAREGTAAHDLFKELMEQVAHLTEALKEKDKTCFNQTGQYLGQIKDLKSENERLSQSLAQKSKAATDDWEHTQLACKETCRKDCDIKLQGPLKDVKDLSKRVEDLRQSEEECNRQRASLSADAGRQQAEHSLDDKKHLEAVESNLKDCYGQIQRMNEEGSLQKCMDDLKQTNANASGCHANEAAMGYKISLLENQLKELHLKMDQFTGGPAKDELKRLLDENAGKKDIIKRLEDENFEMKDVRSKLQDCEHKEKETAFTIKHMNSNQREDVEKALGAAKEDYEKKLGQATRDNQQHTRQLAECTEKSKSLEESRGMIQEAYRKLTGELATGKGAFAQLNVLNQQISDLKKELEKSGSQKDDCERRYKSAIDNLPGEEEQKRVKGLQIEKAALERKMIQTDVDAEKARSNATQLAVYNQQLHEDISRLKQAMKKTSDSLSDCKELSLTPKPPMAKFPVGAPPMGMPPRGMPPRGMPPMGMPQMGMPQMGMPQMGMPQMGMPQMGMPPMGMPPMGMPMFKKSAPEEDGQMGKKSVDVGAVKQPVGEIDEAKELMATAEKLKAAITHAVQG